jgi:L-amino acid N-acyltransferase YncA
MVLIMDPTPKADGHKHTVRAYLESQVQNEKGMKQLRTFHVGTNPVYANQGYAQRAYNSCLPVAKAEGCTRCVAPIGDSNVISIKLHKKLGFVIGKEYPDVKSTDYYLAL